MRAAEGGDPCGDRDPTPAERAAGQVELGLADHPVAPYLPGQVTQLGVGQLGVAHQAVDDRGRAGLDHLVGGVDDDAAGAQDGEHVADAGRQGGGLGLGDRALGPLGEAHAAHRDRTDEHADHASEHCRGCRIHDTQRTQCGSVPRTP